MGIIVIHETDKIDHEKIVIGVTSSRIRALEMITEYYGIDQHQMTEFRDVRDDNIDFSCKITVEGMLGGIYQVWGEYFTIDMI